MTSPQSAAMETELTPAVTMAGFAPLFRSTEELSVPEDGVVVRGAVPAWLSGTFLRLGPGRFDLQDFVVNHWLDGYAVLCKFHIEGGRVTFSKRFLQTDAYKKALAAGRPVFTEYGTRAYPDPARNVFSRLVSTLMPELTDNVAINLFSCQGHVYAATETCNLRRVDVASLDTCEKVDMLKQVGVHLTCPHPLHDGADTYTMGTSFTKGGKYHLIKVPGGQGGLRDATLVTDVTPSWPGGVSYYHSFGMSRRYVVLIEQPLVISVLKVISLQVKGRSLRECMDWRPNEQNRFVVIDKAEGKVMTRRYKAATAFFVLHHVNTYEEAGQLVVDVVALDTPDMLDQLQLRQLRRSQYKPRDLAVGRRFVLPLGETADTMEVSCQKLSPPGYELPVINRKFQGRRYRYYYAAGMFDPGLYRNSLVKVDVSSGHVVTWKDGDDTYPGEPQFVPRPGSQDEDDGVLLTAVTDVRPQCPHMLVVLDARTMEEVARVHVTAHVPNALHGLFVPHH